MPMKPEYRTATAGATAASGMVIVTWLASLAGLHVPPEVSAAASGLVTTALAWAVHRNGAPEDGALTPTLVVTNTAVPVAAPPLG